ncbi:MAG: DUF309 domain-containing protein [Rhizobiaceae bacterium]
MNPDDTSEIKRCKKLAETLELPSRKHVPGKNKRPPEGFMDHVVCQSHAVTVSETADTNLGWLYGLRLLKNGFYWEAHEVLEAIWMRAAPNSRERKLLQAIIHIANSAIKIRMGRPKAALRLRTLADECIAQAFKNQKERSVMQIRLNDVIAMTESHLQKET